jgi:hypothetical protein
VHSDRSSAAKTAATPASRRRVTPAGPIPLTPATRISSGRPSQSAPDAPPRSTERANELRLRSRPPADPGSGQPQPLQVQIRSPEVKRPFRSLDRKRKIVKTVTGAPLLHPSGVARSEHEARHRQSYRIQSQAQARDTPGGQVGADNRAGAFGFVLPNLTIRHHAYAAHGVRSTARERLTRRSYLASFGQAGEGAILPGVFPASREVARCSRKRPPLGTNQLWLRSAKYFGRSEKTVIAGPLFTDI